MYCRLHSVACDVNESVSSLDVKNCGHTAEAAGSAKVATEQDKTAALEQEIEVLKKKIKELEARVTLKFDHIKHSDALVKLYTGCPASEFFLFYCR